MCPIQNDVAGEFRQTRYKWGPFAVILCTVWYWGGLVRQWSRLFVVLFGIGLGLEYRGHQMAAVFIATIGGFIVTVLIGLPSRKPTPEQIAAAAAHLRHEVRRIWEDRRVLLLNEADGVDVGFDRITDLESGGAECPWHDGSTSSIYARYRSIPAGRLIILGPPGSGKTLLAITLVLEMITQGEQLPPGPSVPVPISVSGWDGQQDLGPWLVDRLVEGFRISRAVAVGLVEADYLLPVLDGLDETGTSPRDAGSVPRMILRKLRKSPGANLGVSPRPIVMTCRSDFYQEVQAPDRLRSAVVVEARDVGRAAIEAYLRLQFRSFPERSPFTSALFTAAIERPDSCLVTTLRRPWKLTLALTALQGGGVQPRRLAQFTTERGLSRYLIRAFIPATASIHPRGRRWQRRGARSTTARWNRPDRKYPARDVHRWLATLAGAAGDAGVLAQRIGPADLWLLGGTARTRRLHTAAGITAGLLLAGLAAELVGGTPGYIVTGLTALAGLGFGTWAGLRPPRPRRLSLSQFLTAAGLPRSFLVVAAAALGAGGGFIDGGPATAVTSGIGATLAAITLAGLLGGIVRAISPHRILRNDLLFGATFGLGVSIAAALPGGLTGGIATPLHIRAGLTAPGSAVLALLIGTAGGVILGSRGWTRYCIMVLLVAPSKRIPWQLAYFLSWCYRAGLLRISDVSYEFRHAELRSYLREFPELPTETLLMQLPE
jgi:hypothetical protein